MAQIKKQITVNHPPTTPPETVQDLIDLLAIFPMDHAVCFSPLTLNRLKDRGKRVHFEMSEVINVDFTINEGPDAG